MSRDRTGLYMAGAAIVFAFIAQIAVFVVAAGPNSGQAPVAEARNAPPAK
jgi:hypothetical protein